MKTLSILGSTGSIGKQALKVIKDYPDLFRLHGLAAHRQVKVLAEQARLYKPAKIVIAEPSMYPELKIACSDLPVEISAGPEAVCELAADKQHELVLNAVVGFAGLRPTLAALSAGKNVAVANNDSLVAGGHLVKPLAAAVNKALLPVDCEHSAIFQCLQGHDAGAVEELILTASGGPFFDFSLAELENVTPQAALKHPNWSMGAKITIDSATLMNKGLEVIEAHWLFAVPYDRIKVVVQRESIIHSLVAFHDGAVLAQMGMPDMRVPIQYALTYPRRLAGSAPRVPWEQLQQLRFAPPDTEKFPCLEFAYAAGKTGGTLPAVMNAANEEAVRLFLSGAISFLAIPRIIETVMNKHKVIMEPDFETLAAVDREARAMVDSLCKKERVE